jgi:ubiquinone/menaquinone biosynthesis C-methylase UbiE
VFHYKGEKMAVASSNTDLHGYGEAIRKELAKRIPAGRKLKALDVGTGFGINAAFLAKRLPEGSEVWTVDPSREVLASVAASLGADARRVNFAVASADALKFEGGYFDVVVSVMVLHHIEKLQPALTEMARVLKQGGSLLLVDYNPAASRKLEFKTRHEAKDFFTPKAVAAGMKEVGLPGKVSDHGVWYLVEAKKASARRPPPAKGRAKARRAG